MGLRESVAQALIAEIKRQTDGRWPLDTNGEGRLLMVDDMLDFGELAAAALVRIETGTAETVKQGSVPKG